MTFDYELFFGERTGTVAECMLKRTEELFEIADKHQVRFTFFVDIGYIVRAKSYPELNEERAQVEAQVREMIQRGHDVQLHIHPHWKGSTYGNGKWNLNTVNGYKLADFTQEESDEILRSYKAELDALTGQKSFVYRAGGWCIQPFERLKKVFTELGITHDSTVVSGDFLETSSYAVDFREAPQKDMYRFEEDVCVEQENGSFTELPITSLRYSPLFFWRLYILGRLFPSRHKMLGDGIHLSQGGRKKRSLTSFTTGHVSCDGYFATKLNAGLEKAINLNWEYVVSIGHPKSSTRFSLEKLDQFIDKEKGKHAFCTFSDCFSTKA